MRVTANDNKDVVGNQVVVYVQEVLAFLHNK